MSSCEKWNGQKYHDLTYYSVDHKEKDADISGFNTTEIEAMWFDFSSKDKNDVYTNYTLTLKSNEEVIKETGTCEIDWYNNITFHPLNGDSYTGNWLYEKEKFTISYDSEGRTEEITFIYKEKKKCKKGK